ncbi:hypothetical protein [Marinobacter sp.]|uniref:hypothetical protein n=1 Tax=Marinobacter sp. TaxID=50741 RepID=UPI000C3A3F70|nr:hypothetical protein [Marinobacter sp.]MAO15263.1 hypothetical protein [Marinobacter sp.]|tara:strand:- start:193 stop:516 length:324 start_codon:yes stop_codon:yes gene_type:complete
MESIIELLQQVPAAAWSAIVAAILTSGIAFLGVSYTNRENRKRMVSQHEHERSLRKDELVRERAEELYVFVKKWCSTMISDCSGQLIPDSILRFSSAATGEMPPLNA